MKLQKNVTIIQGAKWGDEGKGKITARESRNADLVIRATGGTNAGHTIIYNGKKLALHLIPGGIIYPQTICVIAPGVLVDPIILLDEIKELKAVGIPDVESRIKISGRAHVVFPYHKELDQLYELGKKNPIGTTKRGIGPTTQDKSNRVGIRMYDLLLPEEELKQNLEEAVYFHNQLFKSNNMHDKIVDAKKLAKEYKGYGDILSDKIINYDVLVRDTIINNKKIVIEGAQAYMLSIDGLDYPDCTSSNCTSSGSLAGACLPPSVTKEVILIDKAYNTRVGNGFFPTEQPAHIKDDVVLQYDKPYVGDIIRELGHEYGATTGRPRRCGWMDCVILLSAKYALGADCLCINHLDTLGLIGKKLGYIKICIAYKYQGKGINYYPDDIKVTKEFPKPVYVTLRGGWEIKPGVKSYDELPQNLKNYIEIIETISGIRVKYLGIGPKGTDLIEI